MSSKKKMPTAEERKAFLLATLPKISRDKILAARMKKKTDLAKKNDLAKIKDIEKGE